MGSRVQSTDEFKGPVKVLVVWRNKCINKFVFPTWACAAGLNNNNYNKNNNRKPKESPLI